MAEPGLALHKALLAALDAALTVDVWDAVPQGSAYPYVTLDTSMAANADYLTSRKDERFVFLSIWSETRGQEEVLSIIGQIDAAMSGATLTLDTGRVARVWIDRKSTQRDADNVTFMGQVVLRIITEH